MKIWKSWEQKNQSLSGTPYALYTEQELHVHNKPVGEEPDDQKEEISEGILVKLRQSLLQNWRD